MKISTHKVEITHKEVEAETKLTMEFQSDHKTLDQA